MAAFALGVDGEEELVVESTANVVHASDFNASATSPDSPMVTATTLPPECSETDYNYVHQGDHWYRDAYWYYNLGTQSRSGLSGSAPLGDIRAGNQNMALDNNLCGYGTQFAAYADYLGTTTRYANINSNFQCTSNFPDGWNVVSWGPGPAGKLALTCDAWNGSGQLTKADIYIASTAGLVDTLPSPCPSSDYDLQATLTHEWGHYFGLAHSGDVDLTMYPYENSCSRAWRTIGRGDNLGMVSMYGSR